MCWDAAGSGVLAVRPVVHFYGGYFEYVAAEIEPIQAPGKAPPFKISGQLGGVIL
jgi:hypothetical protein